MRLHKPLDTRKRALHQANKPCFFVFTQKSPAPCILEREIDSDTLKKALCTLKHQCDGISSSVGKMSAKRALYAPKTAMYVEKEIKGDTLRRALRTLKYQCDGISSSVGEMSSKRALFTLKRAPGTLEKNGL